MQHTHGHRSVTYALVGNGIIAIIKIGGFLVSGSSSLFGEAIHSIADTMNQALLLIGISKSRRVADAAYSYGYGNERFLWALISACGIFFLGAGVTIYHGIEALLEHTHIEVQPIAFAILFISLLVEGFTLYKAILELRRQNEGDTLTEALKHGDPVTLAVVYEDTVAVLGNIVAAIGLALAYATGNQLFDALGSIVIGALLGAVAIILINKNRGFLIGKSIPARDQERIIDMLESEPYIEKVIDFKSSILDIGSYHVKCEVEWNGAALLEHIIENDDLFAEYEEARASYDDFKKFVVYQTNRVPRLMGRTIDGIEKRITAAMPSVTHLDIEIN